ncbi:hypothetical protein P7C71_g5090, partial [Lecanoromycetidae sp. Uapishka_2]
MSTDRSATSEAAEQYAHRGPAYENTYGVDSSSGRAGETGSNSRTGDQDATPICPTEETPRRRSERIEANRQMGQGRTDVGPHVMDSRTGSSGIGNGIEGRIVGRMASRFGALTGEGSNNYDYGERD